MSQTITATLIPSEDRHSTFAHLFRQQWIRTEQLVFYWMRNLAPVYDGGYWHFYRLSNGGFFMVPGGHERMLLQCASNYFEGEVSAEAAGIVACLFAFSQQEANDEVYDQLCDYAAEHPEAELIFAAID